MFERILVPLDGSERAEQAIPAAARLARATNGTLILLRVVPVLPQYAPYLATGPVAPPTDTAADVEEASAYLAEKARGEELASMRVEQAVAVGPPAPTIVDAVDAQAADLVVLCSHGRTGFMRWAQGSVAEFLARHAPAPVVVLHQADTEMRTLNGPAHAPTCVLVPLDGSALAEEALPGAMALARALDDAEATMHLLMVVDFYKSTPKRMPQGGALDMAKKYLAGVRAQLGETPGDERPLHITWSVVAADDVASAILNAAAHGGMTDDGEAFGPCAATAMSTHGRSGLTRMVLGSVTERVLEGGRLPLLIVRAHKTGARDSEARESTSTLPAAARTIPPR